MKIVLTLAGSDTSAGAGIQADLKTFHNRGVYGMSVITALTAQNTQGVHAIQTIDPDFVAAQIDAVMQDFDVSVWKTGMLVNIEIIDVIIRKHKQYHQPMLVVDPVMAASQGGSLLEAKAQTKLIEELFPLATVITPNHHEASLLTGTPVDQLDDMKRAIKDLLQMGSQAVVLKGGHLPETSDAIDLYGDNSQIYQLTSPRIFSSNTHGTGCTFASALAAELAKGGTPLQAAITAKAYVTKAIEHGKDLSFTNKGGSLDHRLGQMWTELPDLLTTRLV